MELERDVRGRRYLELELFMQRIDELEHEQFKQAERIATLEHNLDRLGDSHANIITEHKNVLVNHKVVLDNHKSVLDNHTTAIEGLAALVEAFEAKTAARRKKRKRTQRARATKMVGKRRALLIRRKKRA